MHWSMITCLKTTKNSVNMLKMLKICGGPNKCGIKTTDPIKQCSSVHIYLYSIYLNALMYWVRHYLGALDHGGLNKRGTKNHGPNATMFSVYIYLLYCIHVYIHCCNGQSFLLQLFGRSSAPREWSFVLFQSFNLTYWNFYDPTPLRVFPQLVKKHFKFLLWWRYPE